MAYVSPPYAPEPSVLPSPTPLLLLKGKSCMWDSLKKGIFYLQDLIPAVSYNLLSIVFSSKVNDGGGGGGGGRGGGGGSGSGGVVVVTKE